MKCSMLLIEGERSSIYCSCKAQLIAQSTFSGAFRTLAERKQVSGSFNLSLTEAPAYLRRERPIQKYDLNQ